MPGRKKCTNQRPLCQRKKVKNGEKGLRGIPQIYHEKKKQFNITLTLHTISVLEKVANFLGESRSQVIEKAFRGEINLFEILQDNGLIASEDASEKEVVDALNTLRPSYSAHTHKLKIHA